MHSHHRWCLLALAWAVTACASPPARACLVWPSQLQPLVLGDSAPLVVGTLVNGSDCDPAQRQPAQWTTSDSSVVALSAQGMVRARAPGVFRAVAIAGPDSLIATGFVLPRRWLAHFAPDSVAVAVGDSVVFTLTVTDSSGAPLPEVPYSLLPEFFLAQPRAPSAGIDSTGVPPTGTLPVSLQAITGPGILRATRVGTYRFVAVVGGVRQPVVLVVTPPP